MNSGTGAESSMGRNSPSASRLAGSTSDGGEPEPAALLRLLRDAGRAANEARTVEAALVAAISLIARHHHWAVGHAYVRTEAGGECLPSNAWYVRPGLDAAALRASTAQLGRQGCDELIAAVAESGRPVWIENVHDDARWQRDDGGLALRSAVFYPVRVHGAVRAVLEFYADTPEAPEPARESVIGSVAYQLARVLERHELARRAAMALEDEQRAIGQELHDRLGQNISALALLARSLQRTIGSSAPGQEKLDELMRAIEVTKLELRLLAKGLMPVDAEVGSLPVALGDLATRCRDLYCIRCRFDGDAAADLRDRSKAAQLYRIAQEAIRNAVEHGRAASVVIRLRAGDGRLVLEVDDDGGGFGRTASSSPGMGTRIMEHRAALAGGRLEIESAPGKGSVVRCLVPLP